MTEMPDDADATVNNAYTSTEKPINSAPRRKQSEVYNFRLAKQNASETTDAHHARLHLLAKYCRLKTSTAKVAHYTIVTLCRVYAAELLR